MADPTPVAVLAPEKGQNTSEWLVLLGSAVTLVTCLLALLGAFGVHFSPEQSAAIEDMTTKLAAVASAYIVSRGIRKAGTGA